MGASALRFPKKGILYGVKKKQFLAIFIGDKKMKRAVRLTLLGVVAVAIIYYLYSHGEEFKLLFEFDIKFLPLMLAVPLLIILVNGLIMRLLILQFGVWLRFQEWYGLTVIHAFGNYLPLPQAGALARGIYLKKFHRLHYASFTATFVVTHFLFLATVGILGVSALVVMGASAQPVPWPLWVLFFVLSLAGFLLAPHTWSLPVIRKWNTFVEGINTLRRHHLVLGVVGKHVLIIFLTTAGIWLAFSSLGKPVDLGASLLLSLVVFASGIINVTPGNLGIAETAAWVTAYLLQADADEAVVAFTLFRLMAVITIFSLTPVFMARLSLGKIWGAVSQDQETE